MTEDYKALYEQEKEAHAKTRQATQNMKAEAEALISYWRNAVRAIREA